MDFDMQRAKYVYVLNRIESAMRELEPTSETEEAYNEAWMLVKKLKWAIRDGEPLDVD